MQLVTNAKSVSIYKKYEFADNSCQYMGFDNYGAPSTYCDNSCRDANRIFIDLDDNIEWANVTIALSWDDYNWKSMTYNFSSYNINIKIEADKSISEKLSYDVTPHNKSFWMPNKNLNIYTQSIPNLGNFSLTNCFANRSLPIYINSVVYKK